MSNIESSLNNGGKLLSLQFGNRTTGIATVTDNRIDNLYVEGRFQNNGFGTQLLQYAVSFVGKGAYIVVPKTNKVLIHICERIEAVKNTEDLGAEVKTAANGSEALKNVVDYVFDTLLTALADKPFHDTSLGLVAQSPSLHFDQQLLLAMLAFGTKFSKFQVSLLRGHFLVFFHHVSLFA
jgi:GNAT superfamily N-acetyltransferase